MCDLILGVFVFVQTEYCNCVNKLEKDLISNYQAQFEKLFKAEAPTWETHGNLMVTIRKNSFLVEIKNKKTLTFGLMKNASYLLHAFAVSSDGETGVGVVPAVPEGTVATPGDHLPVLRLL